MGFLGGVLFLLGALAVIMFLAVIAVLSLLLMALFGIVMGAERLLAVLVPGYRRRRRERYITMPTVLVRTVRFGSRLTQVIEANSYELPHTRADTPPLSR
jgi:Flp pilus assembly protein TadB